MDMTRVPKYERLYMGSKMRSHLFLVRKDVPLVLFCRARRRKAQLFAYCLKLEVALPISCWKNLLVQPFRGPKPAAYVLQSTTHSMF